MAGLYVRDFGSRQAFATLKYTRLLAQLRLKVFFLSQWLEVLSSPDLHVIDHGVMRHRKSQHPLCRVSESFGSKLADFLSIHVGDNRLASDGYDQRVPFRGLDFGWKSFGGFSDLSLLLRRQCASLLGVVVLEVHIAGFHIVDSNILSAKVNFEEMPSMNFFKVQVGEIEAQQILCVLQHKPHLNRAITQLG